MRPCGLILHPPPSMAQRCKISDRGHLLKVGRVGLGVQEKGSVKDHAGCFGLSTRKCGAAPGWDGSCLRGGAGAWLGAR